MKRNFIHERREYIDAYEIDTDTGTVTLYAIDKEIGFPLEVTGCGEYTTTPENIGYSDMADFLNTMRRRYKKSFQEVPHGRQVAAEVAGLLRLAKYRRDNNHSYNDIPRRLCYYGLTAEYADKILRYFLFHGIERHAVKVEMPDGDSIDTEINGTLDEIEHYYSGLGASRVEFIA